MNRLDYEQEIFRLGLVEAKLRVEEAEHKTRAAKVKADEADWLFERTKIMADKIEKEEREKRGLKVSSVS